MSMSGRERNADTEIRKSLSELTPEAEGQGKKAFRRQESTCGVSEAGMQPPDHQGAI